MSRCRVIPMRSRILTTLIAAKESYLHRRQILIRCGVVPVRSRDSINVSTCLNRLVRSDMVIRIKHGCYSMREN